MPAELAGSGGFTGADPVLPGVALCSATAWLYPAWMTTPP